MEHTLSLTGVWENQAGRITWDAPAILQVSLAAAEREGTAFADLLKQAQHILLRTRCWCLLVQQQAMPPYTPAERTWLTTYWIPQAQKRGLAYVAVVRPGDLQASLASTAVRMHAGRLPGVIRVFDSQTLASQWLQRLVDCRVGYF